MQLFPAIDLRGGKVVRLTQGDYSRMTVYGEDPCAQAREFLAAGAKNLHVVDLDGAKDGTLSNYDTIAALAKQGGLYIEVGGGIRTEERIETYLSLGVGRCILGSVAVTDFAFTARMLQKYGDKIAVGVDAKDGYVAIHGWNACQRGARRGLYGQRRHLVRSRASGTEKNGHCRRHFGQEPVHRRTGPCSLRAAGAGVNGGETT